MHTGWKHNFLLRLFCWLCLLAFPFSGKAEFAYAHNYSVNEGLPSSEVYDVLQDHAGYMWFATDRGVARFDGVEFEIFTTKDGLTDNVVFKLHQDQKGRIWFLTFNHELCYFENEQFKSFAFNASFAKKKNQGLILEGISVSDQDEIFFAYKTGGFAVIDSKGKYTMLNAGGKNILSLVNAAGRMFLVRKLDAVPTDLPLKELKWTYNLEVNNVYLHRKPKFFNRDSDEFSFSIADTLFEYSLKEGVRKIGGLAIQSQAIVFKDTSLGYWISSYGAGVELLDQSGKYKSSWLAAKTISSIVQDHNGGQWFSTLESGVYYLPNPFLSHYFTNRNQSKNTPYKIDGNGKDELYTLLKFKGIERIKNDYRSTTFSKEPIIGNALYYNTHFQELWYSLGTAKIKGELMDLDGSKIRFLPASYDYVQLKDSTFMGVGNQGVYYVDSSGIPSALSYGDIRFDCVEKGIHGNIWMGGLNGVYTYKDSLVKAYPSSDLKLKGRVYAIEKFAGYNVFSIGGKGLLLANAEDTIQLGVEYGLSSDIIHKLELDDQGRLWLGSNLGLDLLEMKEGKLAIRSFDQRHGLLSNEITDLKYQSGALWVSTNYGLSKCPLEQFERWESSPLLELKSIQIDGDPQSNFKESQVLSANHHSVRIGFSAFTFQGNHPVQFRYGFQGDTINWFYTEKNLIQLTQLASGAHELIIQSQNRDGKWSDEPIQIKFEVALPYYLSTWFLVGMGFVLIGLTFAVLKIRNKRIIKKLKGEAVIRQEIAENQQKALSAQMNPHFIFNCLNSIQDYVFSKDEIKANRFISKFSKLIRMNLENSQQALISLEDELEALEKYIELESIRSNGKFDYEIVVDDEVDVFAVQLPGLILQPFVENAIIHGVLPKEGKGNVSIRVQQLKDQVELVIEDDGRGLNFRKERTAEHKSRGVSITQKRLALLEELIGGSYEFSMEDRSEMEGNGSSGTKVRIVIPIAFYE